MRECVRLSCVRSPRLAKVPAPAVLDAPVLDALLVDAIAYDQHRVAGRLKRLGADRAAVRLGLDVHARAVLLEA
eukprot:550976-Prymnesium_polylepis.2